MRASIKAAARSGTIRRVAGTSHVTRLLAVGGGGGGEKEGGALVQYVPMQDTPCNYQ